MATPNNTFLVDSYPKRDDVVVARAKGTKIFDVQGKQYLDLFAAISVANVGHGHPKVLDAIREQIELYLHVSNFYHSEVVLRLAEKLAKVAPAGLVKSFFGNSGSEAIDGAVKLAKKYAYVMGSSGMSVISLQGSFHGRLSLSLSLSGQRKFKQGFGNYACYPGVVLAPAPYHYRYGGGLEPDQFGEKCAEDMADLIDNYTAGDIAAVVVEPILGEGGIIVPPDTYMPALERVCKQRQISLITDEIQTGLGRTGAMFAVQHWNVKPDIMVLAKALGGGLPIGAFVATAERAAAFKQGDHTSTFGGNPVCCAAAIAVLDVIEEEGLVAKAQIMGEYIMERLKELREKNAIVGDVRGKGMMIGIELVRDGKNKKPAQEEASKIKDEMRRRGFLIGLGGLFRNVIRFQPPLILSKQEADSALQALDNSMKAVG